MNRALLKSFIPPIMLDARRRLLQGAETAPRGYLDAAETVAAAKAAGVSICELRESQPHGPGRPGRRDAITAKLAEAGVFDSARRVLEIGPGTGMFTEKVIERANPEHYEFYEVSDGWSAFLVEEYGVTRRTADGSTLSETPDASIDLVHAHAVFVYLPAIQSIHYLRECARALKPGGHIVFDCFREQSLSTLSQVEGWELSGHRWPVIIPSALLEALRCFYGLREVTTFTEHYAGGTSEYLVWSKP